MSDALMEAFVAAGLRPPASLTLALTDDCNLACGHCWVEARPRGRAHWVPGAAARDLIREFAAMGGEELCLTGGEPLLHRDWLALLDTAAQRGLRLTLQTNALLLGEAELDALLRLAPGGLGLRISLDGADAASHDLVRGAGTFDATLQAVRRLVGHGLGDAITLCFTEMAHNLAEFPQLLELAGELGVGRVGSGTLVAGGRAASAGRLAAPRAEQYLALARRFDADSGFRQRYLAFGMLAALEWWLGRPAPRPCSSLAAAPYLDPAGRLFPCALCHCGEFAVDDVYGRGLTSALAEALPLWSALKRLAGQRADDLDACRDCPERPECAGGCVGRSWGSCGSLTAVDDRCRVRRLLAAARRPAS